jgi:glycosyltransferase involved in cell wall biosynthesis
MKVCILTQSFPPDIGGLQSYAWTAANCLSALGHEVTVVAGHPAVERLESQGSDFRVLHARYLREFCEGEGMFYETLASIRSVIVAISPDALFIQDPLSLLAYTVSCADRMLPIVATMHWTFAHWTAGVPRRDWGRGLLSSAESYELEHALLKSAFRSKWIHSYVAVGLPFVRWFRDLGVHKAKVALLPNFVNVNAFTAPTLHRSVFRQKYSFTPRDHVILCPARLIPRKGIDVLLRAIALCDGGIKLVLAGVTEPLHLGYAEQVTCLVKKLGLTNRVVILTAAIHEMPELYASCDAVVLPSYHEGLSTAILEAMASKRLVIATDIPANRAVILDGCTGVLFPPGNHVELAKVISLCRTSASGVEAMIVAAFKHVSTSFSLDVVGPRLERLLKECASMKCPDTRRSLRSEG